MKENSRIVMKGQEEKECRAKRWQEDWKVASSQRAKGKGQVKISWNFNHNKQDSIFLGWENIQSWQKTVPKMQEKQEEEEE